MFVDKGTRVGHLTAIEAMGAPVDASGPDPLGSDGTEATCRICGNTLPGRPFQVREMMFGSRDTFDYLQCGTCETVQIAHIPSDLGRYYPSGQYYSLTRSAGSRRGVLQRWVESLEFRAIARPSLDHQGSWFRVLDAFDLTEPGVEAVGKASVSRRGSVLEVGCGNGRLLRLLANLGFEELRGIDPFLPGNVVDGRVYLEKRDLDDVDRSSFFDLIVLYHSLEHVPDPVGTLRAVHRHLKRDGVAVVAMPIVNAAFREYGPNWYQLDPPRHLHLFSVKGFEIALARSGLHLSESYFNSTAAQFRISEAYAHDVALAEIPSPWLSFGRARVPEILTSRERHLRSRAHALNAARQGDQAVFYLTRGGGTERSH